MTAHDRAGNPDSPPPDAVLMQMLFWAVIQQSICVAAKLGIPDVLAEQPQTAAELASKTKTHAPSLYRVLRTLASVGIFAENTEQKFELTPLTVLLRSDVPNSMRDFAIMMGEEWMWRAWGALMHSVRTGEVAHVKVSGMGSFQYFKENPEAGEIFNRAMTNMSQASAPAIVAAYDFSQFRKLVDIAGGHGLLLAAVLKANPQVQGVLFDLPHVVEGANDLLMKEGVRERVELASGDFFKSVPVGADGYMMKHIIHDWDDDHSIKLLQNIRSAMNVDGKVLIVEMVVPEGNIPSASKFLDLQMLVMETGKERTEDEYRRLLQASGLRLIRIIPTKSGYSIIEGERA